MYLHTPDDELGFSPENVNKGISEKAAALDEFLHLVYQSAQFLKP